MPVTDEQVEAAAKAIEAAYWRVDDPSDITPRQLARIALEAADQVQLKAPT